MSWYLVQILESDNGIRKANILRKNIKDNFPISIEFDIIKKDIDRINRNLLDVELDSSPLSKSNGFLSQDGKQNSKDSGMKFEDNNECNRFVQSFRKASVTSMDEFLTNLEDFTKLISLSHTKALYYPAYLLKILEEWSNRNFQTSEIEFKINMIRLIAYNLEDSRIYISLKMIQYFSPEDMNNNFIQLFINSITLDIDH